jgi:hypothetical protein
MGKAEPEQGNSAFSAFGGDVDEDTLFPANERTPGQSASRQAWAAIQAAIKDLPWYTDFLELRGYGLDWRKAMAVAWKASPGRNREPATQAGLASMMGLKSDRTIREWFEKQPDLDELVSTFQASPLFQHRRDVIQALVDSASNPAPTNSADRKLFFQLTGDLEEKSQQRLVGPGEGPIIILPAKQEDVAAPAGSAADVP